MQKNIKHKNNEVDTDKPKNNSEGQILHKMRYSISIDPNAGPIINQPIQTDNQSINDTQLKNTNDKKTDLKKTLTKIKEYPKVLKFLDSANKHHKKFSEYKFAYLIQDLQKFLGKSLKAIDLCTDFVVNNKETVRHSRNEVVQQARPAILFGMWVTIITFFVFGIWAAVAPLNSAATATGTVVVESNKKIIQHKEGGIIEAIYVKNGDHVKRGQALIRLSPIDLQASIAASEARKEAISKQLELTRGQVELIQQLFDKGFAYKSRLVDLQIKEASLAGDLSENKSRIIAARDAMSRLDITSPIDGTVTQLAVHTIGGVAKPGEALLDVIPRDDNLVIDAFVDPKDIDSIHVGLTAKIRITAFRNRSTSPLDGVVVKVAPDIIEQHHGNVPHPMYKVRIEVDKSQLTKISKLRNYELYPGMGAEVMIVTGERTLLQYLLDPVTSTFWHAFKEK